MSSTSDNTDPIDPIDPAPRSAGLAGGAARALRAARSSAPAATTPAENTTNETTTEESVDRDVGSEHDVVAEHDEPVEEPLDDVSAVSTADEPTADEPTAEEPTADEPTADEPTADEPTADEDPDAPPVLATVRAPKRKPAGTTPRTGEPDTAEADTSEPDPGEPKDSTRSRLVAISALLTAAALVFAVIAGVVWWRAGHNDTRDDAAARDDVAVEARLAIATVNTSDYRKAANALTNWIDVATGSLEKQFTTSRASATTLLTQARTITTATVLDVAVTRLDTADGTATVIASVNVKKQPATGTATFVRNRFRASMAEVRGEWKLADLAQVDVQIS